MQLLPSDLPSQEGNEPILLRSMPLRCVQAQKGSEKAKDGQNVPAVREIVRIC